MAHRSNKPQFGKQLKVNEHEFQLKLSLRPAEHYISRIWHGMGIGRFLCYTCCHHAYSHRNETQRRTLIASNHPNCTTDQFDVDWIEEAATCTGSRLDKLICQAFREFPVATSLLTHGSIRENGTILSETIRDTRPVSRISNLEKCRWSPESRVACAERWQSFAQT